MLSKRAKAPRLTGAARASLPRLLGPSGGRWTVWFPARTILRVQPFPRRVDAASWFRARPILRGFFTALRLGPKGPPWKETEMLGQCPVPNVTR